MIISWKHVTRRVLAGLSAVVLMVFLAACGGGGSTGSATPTPTTPPSNPSPTAPSTAMQTFTGNGFTISYPQNWKKTSSTNSQTAFQDPTTGNTFTIVQTPDPGGVLSADSLANTTSQGLESSVLTNGKSDSVPASVTINGVTWSQRGASGNTKVDNQTIPAKLILLVTIHPASAATSQAFELIYAGPALTFDLVNAQIFQPMLQSFKFTA